MVAFAHQLPDAVRVGAAEYAEFWRRAEEMLTHHEARGLYTADYVLGVVRTLRWLSGALIDDGHGQAHLARSPIRREQHFVMPENVLGEDSEARRILRYSGDQSRLRQASGVTATISWACHGGPTPLP